MKQFYIDINCDVGEGIGNEAALMPLISSCNIACGGHAGSFEIMTEVIRMAANFGVKVGAHPSYPDPENFGRLSMEISEGELESSIRSQMQDIIGILKNEETELHHIKAHGALYNDIAKRTDLAKIFLSAVEDFKDAALIYLPNKSAIEAEALHAGFKIQREAFADRAYNSDLSLVPRTLPGAVIQNPEMVLHHLIEMVKTQSVTTLKGEKVGIQAETYCVHGDTPSALEILNYLTQELPKVNIRIKK